MPDELYVAIYLLILSPHLLQLFSRILQHCFAMRLYKCFLDYKTSPTYQSA